MKKSVFELTALGSGIAQLNARMLPVLQGLGTPGWDSAMHTEASVTALREEVAALQELAKLMGLFERMSSKLYRGLTGAGLLGSAHRAADAPAARLQRCGSSYRQGVAARATRITDS